MDCFETGRWRAGEHTLPLAFVLALRVAVQEAAARRPVAFRVPLAGLGGFWPFVSQRLRTGPIVGPPPSGLCSENGISVDGTERGSSFARRVAALEAALKQTVE